MTLTTAIILLFVGLAVFMTGMKLMSTGLKKSAGSGMRRLFHKIDNNRFATIGIGASTTAVIQSSAATASIAVGFINAGAMTTFQGFGVVLGAFLGTTVTGLLVSLSSINISLYLLLLAFIGVVLSFFKNDKVQNIGEILTGLGILFFGLETLKQGFSYTEISSFFSDLFSIISFPPLLLLVGIVLSALAQSSSLTTGIAIVMISSGALSFEKGIYIALGATIGTVISTILASIGGNVSAKRLAFLTLFSRVLLGLFGLAIVWVFEDPFASFFAASFGNASLGLAMFTILYNIVGLFIFVPFMRPLDKFAERVIKDKKKAATHLLDENLLNAPALALMQVKKEIERMANEAKANLDLSMEMVLKGDGKERKLLMNREEEINQMNAEIARFLIDLSQKATKEEEKTIGSYYHVINDIERIGDHAVNFMDFSSKMAEDSLSFTEEAKEELEKMYALISQMHRWSLLLFDDAKKNASSLEALHRAEAEVDAMKERLNDACYERLKRKEADMESAPFYTALVGELERVGDHLINVGYSFVSPVGDEVNA